MQRTRRQAEEHIELATSSATRLEGYPSFAEFIARYDAAIYRKFETLSARSLLYQQSELHELEGQLEELDRQDAKDIDDEEAQRAARLWRHFQNDANERAVLRRELQGKIALKLKAYHEALILESQVLSLNAPASRLLKDMRRWFTSTKNNPPSRPGANPAFVSTLWGRDKDIFKDERDLVDLAPADSDRLNIFLKEYFAWFFREEEHSDHTTQSNLYYYPESRIQRAGAVISAFLSAILLIGAIVCLHQVSSKSTGIKVGMIVFFTCLFASVIGLLTNARRAEIFGSTAAYAAVLVVFVSNNVGNSTAVNNTPT